MSKSTVRVERFNRSGSCVQDAEMIDSTSAYVMCEKHMNRYPANIVRIEGRWCYTLPQVETQLRNYFNSIQA